MSKSSVCVSFWSLLMERREGFGAVLSFRDSAKFELKNDGVWINLVSQSYI